MAVTLNQYALTTLEDCKLHLGIQATTTDFDDLVKRFINASTSKIESYCDRKFKRRSYIEFQDGINSNRIMLSQWPAFKPSELWIDSGGSFTDVNNKIAITDYELDFSARGEGIGIVLKNSCSGGFPTGTRNIKIVYDAGFDLIPDMLQDACIWYVEFMYDMRNNKTVGVSTKGKNQENTTYTEDVPKFVIDVLENYKRYDFPTGSTSVQVI